MLLFVSKYKTKYFKIDAVFSQQVTSFYRWENDRAGFSWFYSY